MRFARDLVEYAARDRFEAWALRVLTPTPTIVWLDPPPLAADLHGTSALLLEAPINRPPMLGEGITAHIWMGGEQLAHITTTEGLVLAMEAEVYACEESVRARWRDFTRQQAAA